MNREQTQAEPYVVLPEAQGNDHRDRAHWAACVKAQRPYVELSLGRADHSRYYQVLWDTRTVGCGMPWSVRQRLLLFLAGLSEAERPSSHTMGFRVGHVRGLSEARARGLAVLIVQSMPAPLFGWPRAQEPAAPPSSEAPVKRSPNAFTAAQVAALSAGSARQR